MTYEPVIGIEVHVELNTKSKMFCRCSGNYFGKEPNTHTCPVCLGLPGALPYPNSEAINKCIQVGLALNCKVAEKSIFERKNYFYPDLPKGYQISQYRWPLCTNGRLKLENGRWIRINRVHQEEDTAKLIHHRGDTLIDFNRSGVPLVEIVTEPDFESAVEVRDYAKKLQQIFRYLDVSNADMEKGEMRLEANVSVRPEGESKLPNYRVELKNINSFRLMVQAIEYEIKRQIAILEKGKKITQETRGWDEEQKSTYLQRSKEEAHDYRYFPEPDLPPFFLSTKKIQELKNSLPKLPDEIKKKFESDFGLRETDAEILSATREMAEFFQSAILHGQKHDVSPKDIANYIINKKVDINKILPTQIIEELKGKRVGIIADEGKLSKLAEEAIEKNEKAVSDYKSGKDAAMQVLVGFVMRLSAGKADATKVKEILEKLLSN